MCHLVVERSRNAISTPLNEHFEQKDFSLPLLSFCHLNALHCERNAVKCGNLFWEIASLCSQWRFHSTAKIASRLEFELYLIVSSSGVENGFLERVCLCLDSTRHDRLCSMNVSNKKISPCRCLVFATWTLVHCERNAVQCGNLF